MPNYSWKGRTRAGKTQEGVLVAESKDAVVASLRNRTAMAHRAFTSCAISTM